MNTALVPGLAVMNMTEILVAPAPDRAAATHAAWGSSEIRLLADRVASLRSGSTHKVYRGWRFVIVMQDGHPRPGTTLFTFPVDPALLATSQSRYALVQLPHQGLIAVGDAAAFSWSASAIGTADPFSAALAQVRRQLEAAGWTQDAAVPTCYTKTDPSLPVGEQTEMPSSDTAAHVAVSRGAAAPRTPLPAPLPSAMTALPEAAGLDGWEMDGGTCSPVSEHSPVPGSHGNH